MDRAALKRTRRTMVILLVAVGVYVGVDEGLAAVLDEPWNSVVMLVLIFVVFGVVCYRIEAAFESRRAS